MAEIKISQLSSGTTLDGTEVVPIVQGGATVKVTTQDIADLGGGGGVDWGDITGTLSSQTDLQTALDAKQDDLVSGTNIKTINGSSVLGSGDLVVGGGVRKYVNTTLQTASITPGETLVGSYLIPANTFVSDGSFEFLIKAGVSSGSPNIQAKLYINTSSTLTGATLIATSGSTNLGSYFNFVRNAILSSNVISVLGSTFTTNFDYLNGGFSQSTVTFDVTANRYFLVSLTPSSGTTGEIRGVKFVQYES